MNPLETILSIKNLHKRYGSIQALKNVSFDIHKGNVYGILGPNGSGKSTTLGIVLNVVNKTSGEYNWFNGTIETHEALKKVGAIIERPNFYPYMTATENLELVCKIKGIQSSKVIEKLELVGLVERQNSRFSTFSLGMKQRLAIASALLNDPEILILDEPTNGLDPQGIHQIRDIIKRIASQGTTILLASHLLDEVEKVCTHVAIMKRGNLITAGPVDEVLSNEDIVELGASNQDQLREVITSYNGYTHFNQTDHQTMQLFFPIGAASMEDINKHCFENGVVLNQLTLRKKSLESKFFELTND